MLADDERIRTRVHGALGVQAPHPSLRSRVIASMPIEVGETRPPRWHWVMSAIAVLLAAALVGSLVYIRAGGRGGTVPAGHVVGSLSMTTRLDFSCTLPAQVDRSLVRISLPDGTVTVDQTVTNGKGAGSYGSAYDRGRWLPVPPQWLSPDGHWYAYSTNTTGVPGQSPTSAVFVHDIARGRDRQVWTGTGNAQMLAWAGDALYVSRQATEIGGADDVWAVDPASGAARRVGPNPPPATGQSYPVFVGARFGGGGAWAVAVSQPAPPLQGTSVSIPGGPYQVRRMDLRDGSVSTWFTAPAGRTVAVIGTDAQGHPVLTLGSLPRPLTGPNPTPDPANIYPPAPEVLLLTGPDRTVVLSDGSNPAIRPGAAVGDAHGIWLASPGSLWLYRGGELTRVASVPSGLFPQTTPVTGKGGLPSPPPDYPIGPSLQIRGGCM